MFDRFASVRDALQEQWHESKVNDCSGLGWLMSCPHLLVGAMPTSKCGKGLSLLNLAPSYHEAPLKGFGQSCGGAQGYIVEEVT